MQRRHSKRRLVLLVTAAVLAALVAGGSIAFLVYTADYAEAGVNTASLTLDSELRIAREENYTSVQLWSETPTVGYIFYPGGKVSSDAYLLYLADIARQGYYCAVLEVPFHLAIFGTGRADKVIADNPGIDAWFVGGHSLGGVAAASYAAKQPGALEGIVFLASYPTADLSESGLTALSVTASRDEVLDWDSYHAAGDKLPAGTQFAVVEGGNHAGFGDYGPQSGDGEATLDPEAQRAETVALTLGLLGQAA